MNEKNDFVILVLDKLDYKKDYDLHVKLLKSKYKIVQIVYTEYEDSLIRKVRKLKYVGSFLQHILYWIKSFNYAKKILKSSNNATIICINPIVGIFLGLINKKQKAKVILCGFLFEHKNNKSYYALRKKFVHKCLSGIFVAIVYASQEVDYYKKIFREVDKFKFVHYGIDYIVDEKYGGQLPDEYIFSGGGSNRDYKTLVEAYELFRKYSNIPLCIATLPQYVEGLNTSGIQILTDVVLETFGDVMEKSQFLILSLKETELSAGHQVMLQALKENVPILVNRIQAVEDYVNNDIVTFYESGNSRDLCNKMLRLISVCQNKNIKSNIHYESNYTFIKLLDRLMQI